MAEKWTNQSLRAHLGERGFLQEGEPIHHEEAGMVYTTFVRGQDELTLVEYTNGSEPKVFQDGKEVSVANIGYRNEQLQHDKLKGD